MKPKKVSSAAPSLCDWLNSYRAPKGESEQTWRTRLGTAASQLGCSREDFIHSAYTHANEKKAGWDAGRVHRATDFVARAIQRPVDASNIMPVVIKGLIEYFERHHHESPVKVIPMPDLAAAA